MAKVIKQSLEVKVVDMGGHEFTATDTADAKAGTVAFQKFMAFEIVPIPGADDTEVTYIPYHAIDHVEVKKTSAEEDVQDKNCVEE